MNQEKTIDVLNTLIVINNDRIEGYETASKETEDAELKTLFSQFISTSKKCREELASEVYRLGGTPDEGTRITGKFFRVWMDVKAALTGNDHKAILNSCEYGEDVATHTYQNVLSKNEDELSVQHHLMLNSQYLLIKADHDKVKSLRDSLVEHA